MSAHNLVEFIESLSSLRIVVRKGHEADVAECDDFLDVIEHQLCNGWRVIRPEECGALTEGLILAIDFADDDDGKLIYLGPVYWDEQYQVTDAFEELKTKGEVSFARSDDCLKKK